MCVSAFHCVKNHVSGFLSWRGAFVAPFVPTRPALDIRRKWCDVVRYRRRRGVIHRKEVFDEAKFEKFYEILSSLTQMDENRGK